MMLYKELKKLKKRKKINYRSINMPTIDINEIRKLRGLTADDRSSSDRAAIEQLPTINENIEDGRSFEDLKNIEDAGYTIKRNRPFTTGAAAPSINTIVEFSKMNAEHSNYLDAVEKLEDERKQAAEEYKNALLASKRAEWESIGGIKNFEHEYSREIIDIAKEVSPYYRRFASSGKVDFSLDEWTDIAGRYQYYLNEEGQESANQYLDTAIMDRVAENQDTWEKLGYAGQGIVHSAVGATISFAGNLKGIYDYTFGDYEDVEGLSGFGNFLNAVIDNNWTRYGNDIITWGAFNPDTIQQFKDIGLSATKIVRSSQRSDAIWDFNTVAEAVQSQGFTAASMMLGGALAKGAQYAFKGAKGLAYTRNIQKGLTVAKNAVAKVQKAENATNAFIIPGVLGSAEGTVNALQTKIETQEKGIEATTNLHEKTIDEAIREEIANNYTSRLVPVKSPEGNQSFIMEYYDKNGNKTNLEDIYNIVWQRYQNTFEDSLDQVEFAAAKAGIHDYFINSIINGFLNSTLKAGLQSQTVQRSLKNSRLYGWVNPKDKFRVTNSGGRSQVDTSIGKGRKAWEIIKEPLGEAFEEYLQNISSEVSIAGAETNIGLFLKNKYYGDGQLAVGETFAQSWGAAWNALEETAFSAQSAMAAVQGALGSIIGAPTFGSRAFTGKVDDKGNPIMTYFGRGLNSKGQKESTFEYLSRITPWRSGAISNYKALKAHENSLKDTAKRLETWINDPKNKAKFDGLVGTANWLEQMSDSALQNNEFGYRNSALGKIINDVFMLEKLRGTDFHDSYLNQLTEIANLEEGSEKALAYINSMRQNKNTDQSASDEEILTSLKGNANKVLSIMDKIEQESESIDRLLGNVDDDTKQSLIYGTMMIEDWEKRKAQLEQEIAVFNPTTSRSSGSPLTPEQKQVLAKYGTVKRALNEYYKMSTQIASLEGDIKNLKNRKKLTKSEKAILQQKKLSLKNLKNSIKELSILEEIGNDFQSMLNEKDIMALDNISRAIMLHNGKSKFYSETTTENGKENTQFKAVYSQEQQSVIDNLIQQIMSKDRELLNKIIDLGRIDKSINNFNSQYIEILRDPDTFNDYIHRAKLAAKDVTIKGRYDAIDALTDYKEFAKALDDLYESGDSRAIRMIENGLNKSENPLFKEYSRRRKSIQSIVQDLQSGNKFETLDNNVIDLFVTSLQYLDTNNVDVTDKEAVYKALLAQDEKGNSEFYKYVEKANSHMKELDKMVFTSIEEVLDTYNYLMNRYYKHEQERASLNKEVSISSTSENQAAPAPVIEPNIFEVESSEDSIQEEDKSTEEPKEPKKPKEVAGATTQAERDNSRSAIINTLNLGFIISEHPDWPIAKFANDYNILSFVDENGFRGLQNETIYFIEDPNLTKDTKNSLQDNYSDIAKPIIAVIEYKGNNPKYGKLITLDGKRYQPIAILPSSNSKIYKGATNIGKVREFTKSENEPYIITDNSGTPITSKVSSVNANKLQGISANNKEFATPKELMQIQSSNNIFHNAKQKFLSLLKVIDNKVKVSLYNLGFSDIIFPVHVQDIEESINEEGESFISLLRNDNITKVLNFNSRIKGAVNTLEGLNNDLSSLYDQNGAPIENFNEQLDLIKIKLRNSLENYLHLPNSSWQYNIIVEGNKFTLTLENENHGTINLGLIGKDLNPYSIIKTMILDDEMVRLNPDNTEFKLFKWQVHFTKKVGDETVIDEAGLGSAYDDNILKLKVTSLQYNHINISMHSPFTSKGDINPKLQVSNVDNAQPASPINKPTLTTRGQVQAGDTIIDGENGTVLQGSKEANSNNQALEQAKVIANRIVEDSKALSLSDDENYYQSEDGKTYYRVTSIIQDSNEQIDTDNPFYLPSTNIGTGIDNFVRDFFNDELGDTETLHERYPNASNKSLLSFNRALQAFKNRLEASGITIIPRDVTVTGTLEVKDDKGHIKTINVAGTLDLLGYDQKGNFYIFDMKTFRSDISGEKMEKYTKQLSLYAKFLKNKYGINIQSLNIIPIKVEYPNPNGDTQYSIAEGNQLIVNGHLFKGSNPILQSLIPIKYTEVEIDYTSLPENSNEKNTIDGAIYESDSPSINPKTITTSDTVTVEGDPFTVEDVAFDDLWDSPTPSVVSTDCDSSLQSEDDHYNDCYL
jgi:hypothetical protein